MRYTAPRIPSSIKEAATAAIPTIIPVDLPVDLEPPVCVGCEVEEVCEVEDARVEELAVEWGEFEFMHDASFDCKTVSRSEAPPA